MVGYINIFHCRYCFSRTIKGMEPVFLCKQFQNVATSSAESYPLPAEVLKLGVHSLLEYKTKFMFIIAENHTENGVSDLLVQ